MQYRDRDGRRALAAGTGADHRRLNDVETVYELALEAIERQEPLETVAAGYLGDEAIDLGLLEREGRLLAPTEHPVPTRCWVTSSEVAAEERESSSWFFRGNGAGLFAAGQTLRLPSFAPQARLTPALAAIFVIADDGVPCQLGWALAHVVIDADAAALGGHAYLRPTAVGPQLRLGVLPDDLTGVVRTIEPGRAQERACRLALNRVGDRLAAHFRHELHRRPGDVHVHCLTVVSPATTAEEIAHQSDAVYELALPAFGAPLRNRLGVAADGAPALRML